MKISNELKVGLLALVATAILAVGYNFLKGKNLFDSRKVFTAQYERIDGLLVGNPVQVKGFNVGIVDDIRYIPESQTIQVTMLVDNDINVPKNADAIIQSSGLMGDMAVRIDLKAKEGITGLAESGDVLKGRTQQSISETLTNELTPVRHKVEELMGAMDTLVDAMRVNLSSERMDHIMGNVDESMASVSSISKNLASTSKDLDAYIEQEIAKINVILKDVSDITSNLKSNNADITKVVKNAAKISDEVANSDLKGSIEGLKQTVEAAQESMAGVNKLLASVERGEGSLGKLMTDEGLYTNLEKSAEDLDKLLIDLKQHPKRYVSFSVFGKKDKKKNKGEQPIPAE